VSARIDAWARVHPGAVLADDVIVGPFAVVGDSVTLGAGTELRPHAVVQGPATLGARNLIHSYACVGGDPQDLSFKGEEVMVEVGDDNVFREHVTVSRGTLKEQRLTRIGSRCLFMAGSHVAHDCVLGNGVILGNNVLLAGHVHVEDRAILNGAAAVNHFATIGRLTYVGGLSRIVQDVPPFMVVEGNPARVIKVNAVGMRRAGAEESRVRAVKDAHRLLWRSDHLVRDAALDSIERAGTMTEDVAHLVGFLRRQMAGKNGRAREALRG
jgi:UDP-N-acetylglucosamine acyltransferase